MLCGIKSLVKSFCLLIIVFFIILTSAYMIYINQWMVFAEGMYIADIKEKIYYLKYKRVKAFLDCFLSSGALFLDYHLLRMNMVLMIAILIVLYGIR